MASLGKIGFFNRFESVVFNLLHLLEERRGCSGRRRKNAAVELFITNMQSDIILKEARRRGAERIQDGDELLRRC